MKRVRKLFRNHAIVKATHCRDSRRAAPIRSVTGLNVRNLVFRFFRNVLK